MASQTPDMLITRHVYKLQIFNKYSKMFDVIETKWASVDNLRCINPRTTRGGGGYHPPWRFSPITFLMIPTGKIASVYLLLGIEDTFWHMWHHLDAVTWHMSWRQQSMTIGENTVVLPLYVYHDIFRSICDTAMRLVLFLTFSRSRNSKMLKLFTWPWRMTLKFKVKLP